MMQLDVYDGDVRIDTLTLTNDTTCLGRALDVDIRIEHASTSRKHCEIIRDPGSGAYLLVDLKSSQGTHLNGARIPPNEPQKLLDGHHIRLGASARTYKVIIDDGAAAAAAAAQAAAAAASDRESEDRARYERERYERQRADDERYERERADRERYERERYDVDERERGERERDERERVERDERDRYERERADRERYERERAERERMDSMIRDRPSEASAPLVRKNSYGGSVAPGGSSYSVRPLRTRLNPPCASPPNPAEPALHVPSEPTPPSHHVQPLRGQLGGGAVFIRFLFAIGRMRGGGILNFEFWRSPTANI
ncbi:SMAD/FHA domain-containing protein [Pavlovales sp. CCMP2436]|nr:SMAD/FHA domain-containing protein [Pavlovales sp. CCMP2436]